MTRHGGNDPDVWAVKCETCEGTGRVDCCDMQTARALEIVLSRCKLDNLAALSLKYLLAAERQKIAREARK